jgi:uncharacterized protein (TIGR02217 family)
MSYLLGVNLLPSTGEFWSIWDPSESAAGQYWPRRDDALQLLALQAIYEYWVIDGHNQTSAAGVPMIQTTFMSVWNWDARPFPVFPQLSGVWGDAGDWPAGNWVGGKGPFFAPLVPSDPPAPGSYATFPLLATLGWSVKIAPVFATGTALHVSGRELRVARYASPLWTIELNYDLLRMASPEDELQTILGFFEERQGENASFYFEPPALSPVSAQVLGSGDGMTTIFAFTVTLGGATIVPANIGTAPNIYLDGVLQSGGYTVAANPLAPTLIFATAPGPGAAVSADFHWYFLCRISDDNVDSEEFLESLYALRSLRLKSVRS